MELEEAVRMAREAGALVENWMTNPPKPGLFYLKPEQLLALANAIEAKAVAKEREACALACEAIETDKWALYKGRAPYTGREPGRASDYTQGESGGAGECAAAIRARGATDGKPT